MKEKNGKMKELFKGWYDYSEKEYEDLLKNSIIVLDTNILLDLFRYSNKLRDTVFQVLEKYSHRLWIPYTVGVEFFRNKHSVVIDNENFYEQLEDSLKNNIESINKLLTDLDYNVKSVKDKKLNVVNDDISNLHKNFLQLIKIEKTEKMNIEKNIGIENRIISLLNNKIALPNSEEYEKEIYEEGIRRFNENIPPGYKDKDKLKSDPNAINGDYHIFAAMLTKAKEEKVNMIFITRDTKEDMYLEYKGRTIKPRPELLNEFYKETGQLLQIYTMDKFLFYINKIRDKENETLITDDVIDKIKDIRILDNEKKKGYDKYFYHKAMNKKHYDYLVMKNKKMNNYNDFIILKYAFDELRNAIVHNLGTDSINNALEHFQIELENHKDDFDNESVYFNILRILKKINMNRIKYNSFRGEAIYDLIEDLDYVLIRELIDQEFNEEAKS